MAVSTYLEMLRGEGTDNPENVKREREERVAALVDVWMSCYPNEVIGAIRGPGWIVRERAWIGERDPLIIWRALDWTQDAETIKRQISANFEVAQRGVWPEPYDCVVGYVLPSGGIAFELHSMRLLET